jgi:hypothetical protein
MPFILALVLLTLAMPTVFAEAVDAELSAWQTVVLSVPLKDKINLTQIIQTRQTDNSHRAERFLLFEELNYYLDAQKHWSAGVGTGWAPGLNPEFNTETRTYGQINYRRSIPTGTVWIRNQLNQRYLEDTSGVSHWNRTLVHYAHPFKRWPGTVGIVGGETFFTLNDLKNGPTAGFDQQHLYVMLGRTLNKHAELDTGYMLIWKHRPGPAVETLNHIIMTQLVLH